MRALDKTACFMVDVEESRWRTIDGLEASGNRPQWDEAAWSCLQVGFPNFETKFGR